MDERGSEPGDFVGGDGHADACATDEDAAVGLSGEDLLPDMPCFFWVVAGLVGACSDDVSFVTEVFDGFEDL